MLKLLFNKTPNLPLKALFLGAHSDDIEIGCGGTILRLIEEDPSIQIHWVVFTASGNRADEAKRSAEDFISGAENTVITVKNFRDGYFPSQTEALKDLFGEMKTITSPDIIFTHFRNDLHQDHRQICELTWNTWRDHFILEYEIPKYDGDLQSPNFFVDVNNKQRERKIDLLLNHFQTQKNKHWFSAETFNAILRLRGIESKSPSGYSEGFYCRKLLY